jgi:glycosidase
VGLATPVLLQPDTTIINLEDFFPDDSKVDSVMINDLKVLQDDAHLIRYAPGKDIHVLNEMQVWVEGKPYSILVRKSRKIAHTFTFDPKGRSFESVRLAGTINGWNPSATALEKNGSIWQTTFLLNPGTYFYQVVTDGHWGLDPANPDSADNNMGGYNSVVKIGDIEGQERPFLYTLSYSGNKVTIGLKNPEKEYFVFYQNYRLPEDYLRKKGETLQIIIPGEAIRLTRSFIRVWAYNDAGESNDILIPLEYGKVIADPAQLSRNDNQNMIIYNIMVDRFFDGDKSNDHPVPDTEILPKANYQGGDIKGITDKINEGFFSDLGVNTIWMSPVIQNPEGAWGLYPNPRTKFSGYHGYWPISFTRVDNRFGTHESFREMVSTAHEKNLNVLLDFVAHHVHKEHPFYKEHPDWVTNLYLPDGSLNTERWDEYRLTTWFDVFLPTLDLSRPEVYGMLSDSAVYWLREYQLDGFRHDATKHIPEVFWRTLTKKIKLDIDLPEKRSVFQIGETYGNGDLISSYINSGELDAQFDFNVYDAAIGVFVRDNEPFKNLINTLRESFMYYGNHNLMGYITGNQDRARFISFASGSLAFSEDGKRAGWTRDIEVNDPVGYKKMAELIAFNMTIPGIPVIFYGDEIGMPGGNDPDNRRMMKFSGLNDYETELRNTTKELIRTRKENLAFIFGDFELLEMSTTTLAFSRSYFERLGIAVFNKGENDATIEFELPERFISARIKSHFGNQYNITGNKVLLTLHGHSFEILTN